MEQKVERKPLFDDENTQSCTPYGKEVAVIVRDFYEHLIDIGDLVIPKTGDITCVEYGVDASTGLVEHVSTHYCRECHLRFECRGLLPARLCPGCGARIID